MLGYRQSDIFHIFTGMFICGAITTFSSVSWVTTVLFIVTAIGNAFFALVNRAWELKNGDV